MILVAVEIPARYRFHLGGAWRRAHAIAGLLALYLNVFVPVVRLFRRVPL